MISFLVVETGLQAESRAGEYSTLWEDGLMSVFFDAGHIVSNGTVLRLEKNPTKDFPEEVQADFAEAREGGADFFVLALLEYRSQGGAIKPSGVSLRIFSVASRKLIYQQRFAAGTGAGLDEEYACAREAGKAIMSHIKDR